jgi:arylsulfatase A-like enzyme
MKCVRIIGLLAATATVACQNAEPTQRSARPNVLVIVTDDQRADTLWAMPATRRLIGKEGVTFENAVVTTPLCCPSRASIYSGMYAHNHGVWDNHNASGILDTDSTVQRVLRDNGYFTAHVDRYLNRWSEWTNRPPDFDLYAIQLDPLSAWEPRNVLVNGRRSFVREYSTKWIKRKAIRFIERFESRDDSNPWLTFVTTRAPHLPAVPEAKYRKSSVCCFTPPPSLGETLHDKPELGTLPPIDIGEVKRGRRNQLRSLKSVDDGLADLVTRLEELDELRNTLIIFTSDNGYFWGEHNLTSKRWPYDESIRVPLLMRWDGQDIQRGTIRSDVVANIDIAPTIYDASGIEPPYTVDGSSLLTGEPRSEILIEYTHDPGAPNVPPYRAIWTPGDVFVNFPASGRNELYLEDDPFQLHNLYHSSDDVPDPQPYLERIGAWSDCSGSDCP